jgi:hypothetical protein
LCGRGRHRCRVGQRSRSQQHRVPAITATRPASRGEACRQPTPSRVPRSCKCKRAAAAPSPQSTTCGVNLLHAAARAQPSPPALRCRSRPASCGARRCRTHSHATRAARYQLTHPRASAAGGGPSAARARARLGGPASRSCARPALAASASARRRATASPTAPTSARSAPATWAATTWCAAAAAAAAASSGPARAADRRTPPPAAADVLRALPRQQERRAAHARGRAPSALLGLRAPRAQVHHGHDAQRQPGAPGCAAAPGGRRLPVPDGRTQPAEAAAAAGPPAQAGPQPAPAAALVRPAEVPPPPAAPPCCATLVLHPLAGSTSYHEGKPVKSTFEQDVRITADFLQFRALRLLGCALEGQEARVKCEYDYVQVRSLPLRLGRDCLPAWRAGGRAGLRGHACLPRGRACAGAGAAGWRGRGAAGCQAAGRAPAVREPCATCAAACPDRRRATSRSGGSRTSLARCKRGARWRCSGRWRTGAGCTWAARTWQSRLGRRRQRQRRGRRARGRRREAPGRPVVAEGAAGADQGACRSQDASGVQAGAAGSWWSTTQAQAGKIPSRLEMRRARSTAPSPGLAPSRAGGSLAEHIGHIAHIPLPGPPPSSRRAPHHHTSPMDSPKPHGRPPPPFINTNPSPPSQGATWTFDYKRAFFAVAFGFAWLLVWLLYHILRWAEGTAPCVGLRSAFTWPQLVCPPGG